MGEAIIIIPVLLSLFIFKRFRSKKYFFAALLCNTLPFLLQQLLKSLFAVPRPMSYYKNPSWHIHYLKEWPLLFGRSLPSGHSVGAFSCFCFLSLLLPGKYKKFGLLFFVLALLVGYSRIYLAAHFLEDVYFGSIVGWITSTLIFSVMNKFNYIP
jgi:membrane-associated phospholipid phosphatase